MKKLVIVNPGEVYAIPLSVSDQSDLKRFSLAELAQLPDDYAFCRIIEDRGGSGVIIEVFKISGNIGMDPSLIVTSGRLFPPVAISGLGVYKRRWRKIHTDGNFDREKDAGYSQISLVLGAKDDLRLWRNGKETPISIEASKQWEPWTIWSSSHLEKRIISLLKK